MEKVFHTILTTKRHREIGYCESSDFAKIELVQMSPDEKNLVVSFNDNSEKFEFVEFNKEIYIKTKSLTHFSRDEERAILKKQGKFNKQSVIKILLDLRERKESNFSGISDSKFLLIGKTLYERYCKKSELGITVCGNLMFSYWLSIDIEARNTNKVFYPLNAKSFERVFTSQKKRFDEGKPKKGVGDGHVSFSYPTKIVWGDKYK